ncbi:MAG: NADH-quinone oxidoreductase subunit NuoN [Alphaproteobacteria bacterium]|nr:NADH-quinone oxidoreductase subunit NuoN [Alphaproteobacteria bacterium]
MISDFNLVPLLPEIFMALTGMGLLIVGVSQGNRATPVICAAAGAALSIAALVLLSLGWDAQTVMNGMFRFDEFAGFMKLLVLIGLIASLALSSRYLTQEDMARFEYPILIIFAGIGMMMMISANNFLTLYMGLELQSLSLYVLAAFQRYSVRSAEAGIKYFILGALSSGMLLFGISLIYGFSGTLDFTVLGKTIIGLEQIPIGLTIGLVFLLAGIAFKISAAPFHMWTPDVYHGAPTSVTALFAIVPKVAAFALLMRLLFQPFADMQEDWFQIIYFLSVFSMVIGAFAAIAQENLKRLMAYSSIGNMGYALIGIAAGTAQGAGAVVLYLMIYIVMTAGVFAVILHMRRQGLAVAKIDNLAGLSKTEPALAYGMLILMFSMSGIPPAAGFFGKLAIFNAAMNEGLYVLAVLGVVTSVVAAFYYLRIVKVMFFDEPADSFDKNEGSFARRVVLIVSVLFVIGFIIKPSILYECAMHAASALFTVAG